MKTIEQVTAELDAANQTIRALDARLAGVEEAHDRTRRELEDVRAAEIAARQERDGALATANAAIADERALRGAAEQERDVYLARVVDRDKLAGRVAALEAGLVEQALADARRAGILRSQRDDEGRVVESRVEARLRRIARTEGLEAMRAELAEMPRIMPALGRVVLADEDPNPRPATGEIPTSVLESTAAQLELEPSELADHAHRLAGKVVS